MEYRARRPQRRVDARCTSGRFADFDVKGTTMEKATNQSIDAPHRVTLPEVDWADVKEPGCYVDASSGDLYRIPREALLAGASPIITRESTGAARLRQLSPDPYLGSLKARVLCAQHNVQPNF
jgi:hypothetical protein